MTSGPPDYSVFIIFFYPWPTATNEIIFKHPMGLQRMLPYSAVMCEILKSKHTKAFSCLEYCNYL